MWRNYDDVQDSWDSVTNILKFYGENKQNFANFSGPGGFSDPDQVSLIDTVVRMRLTYCEFLVQNSKNTTSEREQTENVAIDREFTLTEN